MLPFAEFVATLAQRKSSAEQRKAFCSRQVKLGELEKLLIVRRKQLISSELDADIAARHTAELYGFCRAKGEGCRCGRPKKSDLLPRKRRRRRQERLSYTSLGVEFMQADPCSYCGEVSKQFDHIEPLSRGGSHEAENLTRTCWPCNRAKNTQSLLRFLARRVA